MDGAPPLRYRSEMPTVHTIEDLSALVASGFCDWGRLGHVRVRSRDGLLVSDDTSAAGAQGRWSALEQISRGLILDAQTGEVCARPFDKFWGWGEGGRRTDAPVIRGTRKLDGSLGIGLRRGERASIATRSGPWSEPARRASAVLQQIELDQVDPDWTLLFEILDPQQPKVFDSVDALTLILLAARSRSSGSYAPVATLEAISGATGLALAPALPYTTIEGFLDAARTEAGSEGFVVEHADGSRFKVKTRAYLDALSRRHQLSPRRIARILRDGGLAAYRSTLPTDAVGALDDLVGRILSEVEATEARILALSEAGPASPSAFGAWVKAEHPELRRYLLACRRGEDLRALILRRAY